MSDRIEAWHGALAIVVAAELYQAGQPIDPRAVSIIAESEEGDE